MLYTSKHFDHDDYEEKLYRLCLELGHSENEAREAARDRMDTQQDLPELCSRCSQKLTVPFIFWEPNLDIRYIGFHVECAEHVILELERNALQPGASVPYFGNCPPDDFSHLCPRCYEEITAPFMQWTIPNICDLYFHLKCAEGLILALKRDVIEYRHGPEFAQSWYAKAKGST